MKGARTSICHRRNSVKSGSVGTVFQFFWTSLCFSLPFFHSSFIHQSFHFHSFRQLLFKLFDCLFHHSFLHLFIHSIIHLFINSFINAIVHLIIHFSLQFFQLFIRSLIKLAFYAAPVLLFSCVHVTLHPAVSVRLSVTLNFFYQFYSSKSFYVI